MAITAATRTQLIGLSVAMLGQAPGTDRLNHWVADIDDDAMSVEDLANHIAESEAFQSEYPAFLTSMEFAEAFLGSVLPGLDEASMTEAVDIVSGMLDSGTSRGALALAVVDFLHDVAMQGMDHGSYESFGMSAMTMANKVSVASHYTLNARMMEPSSDVLANVTADADSVMMATDAIDNPPAPPEEPVTGDIFQLTPLRDNWTGTDQDDTIIAEPTLNGVTQVYTQPLQPFDTIDGGEGNDTLEIYDISAVRDFTISNADVSNIENVVVHAQNGIIADMRDWEGVETIDLRQFNGNILVTVPGIELEVSGNQSRAGNVTVIGAAGAVEWEVGSKSAVTVGSAGHTTSVMVKGGQSVSVHNGAGKPSETVTSVSIDGVNPDSTPGEDEKADEAGIQDDIDTSKPTTAIHSNAIETVSLANTFGTVLIENRSAEAEDLMLTLNNYGGQYINKETRQPTDPFATLPQAGKICLTGDGAAENVTIDLAGNARVELASNVVKSISVMGEGRLNLDVNEFSATDFDVRPTQSLETITVTGGAGVSANLADHDDLVSIDASASTADNSFSASIDRAAVSLDSLVSVATGSGDDSVSLGAGGSSGKLEAVSTGDGDDSVSIAGSLRSKGVMVDLGAGDDSYSAGADNRNSRVDAGEGRDTLNLAHGTGSTVKNADGEDESIYSGFEVLNIRGGGSGKYNLNLLGIEEVIATGNTLNTAGEDEDPVYATVVLEEVAGGTPIHVSGSNTVVKAFNLDARGTETTVKLSYELSEDATAAGTLIGGSSASILNVSLTAKGGSSDSKEKGAVQLTGQATLELTALDTNIRGIVIDSNASLHPIPREGKDKDKMEVEGKNLPGVGNYENMFVLQGGIDGADSSVREVEITGESKLNFSGGAFESLQLVDASKNGAGVTVNVSGQLGDADAKGVTMYGSAKTDKLTGGARADKLFGNGGKDTLAGGAGNDELTGGAAADTLTGGAGADKFRIGASDSMLSGFDTITDFGTDSIGVDGDQILLSRTLYDSLRGGVKSAENTNLGYRADGTTEITAAEWAIDNQPVDDGTTDQTPDSLAEFLAKEAEGIFEQRGQASGNNFATVTKRSIVTVHETNWVDKEVEANPEENITAREKDGAVTDDELSYRTWVLIDVDGDGDFDAGTDMLIALTATSATAIDVDASAFGVITS